MGAAIFMFLFDIRDHGEPAICKQLRLSNDHPGYEQN